MIARCEQIRRQNGGDQPFQSYNHLHQPLKPRNIVVMKQDSFRLFPSAFGLDSLSYLPQPVVILLSIDGVTLQILVNNHNSFFKVKSKNETITFPTDETTFAFYGLHVLYLCL